MAPEVSNPLNSSRPDSYTTAVSIPGNSGWVVELINNDLPSPYTSIISTDSASPTFSSPAIASTSDVSATPSSSVAVQSSTQAGITTTTTSLLSANSSGINAATTTSFGTSSTSIHTPVATTSPPINISTQTSNSTGYIAGLSALAALLALAFIAIAFLLLRLRKQDHRGNYTAAYEAKSEENSPRDVTSPESTIGVLETQLAQKESQLRDTQAALLQHGHREDGRGIDDKQIHERFARLCKSINDWTVTHFETTRHDTPLFAQVEAAVRTVSPNFESLLQDPRSKFFVIRGLVAEILFQAIATGELLGNPAFSELKHAIGQSDEWRSLTLTLLENSPGFQAEKDLSVQEISQRIDEMTSNLTRVRYSEARLHHLHQVVEAAAVLALDIDKQQTSYKIEKPRSSTFDAMAMEDVLQEHKAIVLQGKPIQGVVFPSITKDAGREPGGRSKVIFKAQVII